MEGGVQLGYVCCIHSVHLFKLSVTQKLLPKTCLHRPVIVHRTCFCHLFQKHCIFITFFSYFAPNILLMNKYLLLMGGCPWK